MPNYVYIATSLDGFIATNTGGLEWLEEVPNPEGSDFGYADFMADIDAIVMGRKTFEKILTFDSWPYDKPVYILSRSKVNVPKKLMSKVKTVRGNPKELVNQLRDMGHQNLYIDGGITIQGFLEEDLIDEMIIARIPILLGNGIPLFGKITRKLYFTHKRTEVINDMLVKSYYIRTRE